MSNLLIITIYYDIFYLGEIMKNKKNKFKYLFMIWIFIFIIGLVKRTLQNDTFYTIKIGELIINNGIDMLDHFSWHQNLAYTYPHWLYDVFIYLIFHLTGYRGLYISSMILLFIVLLIVFKVNLKNTNNYTFSALGVLLCAIALSGYATARAQLVSFILFALEIYFIESYLRNGNKRNLIGLLLVSLFICNVHVAVWPFYFIVYLPYLAEYLITIICNKIKLKKENKFVNFIKKRIVLEKNKYIKYLFITMLLSLMTGLITPIGNTPYTYFIKLAMGNAQSYVSEHQMMTWIYSPFTIIIAFETFFFALISKIKLRDLFMISGLTLMSILSVRHISLLALIGTICFTREFVMFLSYYDFNIDDMIINFFNKKIVIFISYLLVIISIPLAINYRINNEPYIDNELYPVDAVKYIKENIDIDKMRIFNEYNYGSYLLLNDIPVFIDSRADLYTKQFSGFDYDILDDFEYMISNYQEKFEFYNITHVILKKEDNPFYKTLLQDENYTNIYEDEYFILFKKIGSPTYFIKITNEN